LGTSPETVCDVLVIDVAQKTSFMGIARDQNKPPFLQKAIGITFWLAATA